MQKYVTLSLELHLFFARIMKEHAFFLEAGFMPKDANYKKQADYYKIQFEQLLQDVVCISGGLIRENVLESGEILTQYTYDVEKKTQCLTGIKLNSDITLMEEELFSRKNMFIPHGMDEKVDCLNQRAIKLLDGLIQFKEMILSEVCKCCLFTANYPLLIDHILREAKLYRTYVLALQNGEDTDCASMRNIELFWNQIMMEHAMFIRGLLDPTEKELIDTADKFAKEYEVLLEEARNMTTATMDNLTCITIKETMKYRDFKEAGTKGIEGCEIQSIILPLLADHVLREANHYLRLLNN